MKFIHIRPRNSDGVILNRAGLTIAVNTDAHSTHELDFMRCGIDQARRAGLSAKDVLNCLAWPQLKKAFAKH